MLPTASSLWTTASSSRRARPSRCSTNRRRNALADFCARSLPRMPPPLDRDGDSDGPGFDYGWVRGAGSGAFIVGLVLSGQLVGRYGIAAVIWLNAALLAAAALCAPRVRQLPPRPAPQSAAASPERGSVVGLFRLRQFRRVVLVARDGSRSAKANSTRHRPQRSRHTRQPDPGGGPVPRKSVRNRLPAGGSGIRTLGPPR